jgi:hypothetical protein
MRCRSSVVRGAAACGARELLDELLPDLRTDRLIRQGSPASVAAPLGLTDLAARPRPWLTPTLTRYRHCGP